MTKNTPPHIIFRAYLKTMPNKFEISAAWILADYFKSDIEFIPSGNLYRPDIFVTSRRQFWEIKTPRGNSKNTIHHALQNIELQSENVVLSLLNTKMAPKTAVGRVKSELSHATRIKRLLIITKQRKVLEIKV